MYTPGNVILPLAGEWKRASPGDKKDFPQAGIKEITD